LRRGTQDGSAARRRDGFGSDGLGVMEILLFALPVAAASLGIAVGRWDTDGDWHKRYTHKCGWHSKHGAFLTVCPKCGDENAKFKTVVARALFPLGWEFKDMNK